MEEPRNLGKTAMLAKSEAETESEEASDPMEEPRNLGKTAMLAKSEAETESEEASDPMEEPRNLGKTAMLAKSEAETESEEVHRKMSADKIAHDMENQLDNLSALSGGCIYRVPERLRQGNEKAYTPRVVSIGPLHHGNESLKAMEEHKLRYLRHFLNLNGVRLSDCIQKIQEQENRLRDFYAEPIVFDTDEFVRIVSVDAAFVIDLLLRFHYSNYREEEGDYIFRNPTMIWDVVRDLKLLENQLPFFILQDLFTLSPSSLQLPSLLQISYYLFQSEIHTNRKIDKICSSGVEVQHFVDLIRILYLPLEPEKKPKTRDTHIIKATPNVTELLQAGVKFKVGKDSSLFDIKFSGGILEIPKLTVDDSTDLTFRNLLAFEQCHDRKEYPATNYVFLMKRLAKTSKDVELLVEKGIIENWLGDTQKISTLLQDLGTGVSVDDWYYATLCKDLIEYRTSPWHKFKENFHVFLQTYAITPWFIISSVPAVILLILTFIQTICSIKSID